jgi:hypothetical protein
VKLIDHDAVARRDRCAYIVESCFRTALLKRVHVIATAHEIELLNRLRGFSTPSIEALNWHPVRVPGLRSAEGGVAAVHFAIALL